jgi:hypothetical protein
MTGHDFDSLGGVDIEIRNMFGLRTFKVIDGALSSVVAGTGHWVNGECTAICNGNTDPDHVAPADDCRCGIYATHSLDGLMRQYRAPASRIVAVIQATGATVTGDTGFRTAKAQIVAYWLGFDARVEAAVLAEQCPPDAQRWHDRDLMARIFELEGRS